MSRVYCYVRAAEQAADKMASMKEKGESERIYAHPV